MRLVLTAWPICLDRGHMKTWLPTTEATHSVALAALSANDSIGGGCWQVNRWLSLWYAVFTSRLAPERTADATSKNNRGPAFNTCPAMTGAARQP